MKIGELVSFLVNNKQERKLVSGIVIKINEKTFLVKLGNKIVKRKKERDLVK